MFLVVAAGPITLLQASLESLSPPFWLIAQGTLSSGHTALLRFEVMEPSFLSWELLSRVLWIPAQSQEWPHELPWCGNTSSSCCLYTRKSIVYLNQCELGQVS